MKRMILLAVLALGLLSVVTNGTAELGLTTASAQIMGRELVAPSYECEDDFGKYESSFPCDMEAEACVCKDCHTQVPCDEMEAHKKTHEKEEEDEPTDPENPWGNEYYPPIDTGGGGGHTGGGGGHTSGGGSWGGDSSSSYATGKAAVDKMETDIKSGNVQYYKAEIINPKDQLVNTVDIMSNISNVTDNTGFLLETFKNIKNSVAYQAISESMAHLGVGISMASTAAIFVEKGTNLSAGDYFLIASDLCGIVATYTSYVPAFINISLGFKVAGVCCCLIGNMINYHGSYYIKLSDGRLLQLKPMFT